MTLDHVQLDHAARLLRDNFPGADDVAKLAHGLAEMARDSERADIIEGARKLDAETLASYAADSGPGAFESVSDRELAGALEIISGHGFADEQAGDVDRDAHGARVGRFVLWTYSSGSRILREHENEFYARRALARAEQDPE